MSSTTSPSRFFMSSWVRGMEGVSQMNFRYEMSNVVA